MRKLFTLILFTFTLLFLGKIAVAQYFTLPTYCNPTVVSPGQYNIGIENVTLGTTINNNSLGNGPPNYVDFTNLSVAGAPGTKIFGTVKNGNGSNTTKVIIFVDWNQDGTFNTTAPEMNWVSGNFTAGAVVPDTITIPAAQAAGIYRIRFTGDFGGSPSNQPCNLNYGDIEDYTLVVTAASTDASVMKVTAPTFFVSGNNNLSFSMANLSTVAMTSVNIGYQLGTNTPVTQSLSSLSVPSGGIYTTTFSTPLNIPSLGTYFLKVWLANVNGGGTTTPANDTLGINFTVYCNGPLNGVYTINPSGSGATNFTSFGAADSALISCGVSGPVIFNVATGTYTEQISIPTISGASATNTITFKSNSGVASDVILTYSANVSNNYTVRYNGANYVNFKNMTIAATNSSYGTALFLTSNASVDTFSNITFNGVTTTNNTTNLAVIASTNSISNFLYFDACRINNGAYGTYFNSTGNNPATENLSFNNCDFVNQYAYGMSNNNLNGLRLTGNRIVTNSTYTGYYGIYNYWISMFSNNNRVLVTGNKISGAVGGYGIYNFYIGVNSGSSVAARRPLFANNMIDIGTSTNQTSGLRSAYDYWSDYLHNSINIGTSDNSGSSAAAYFETANSNPNVVQNNIFSGSNGAPAVRYNAIANYTTVNFNDLYSTGTNLAYLGTTGYTNIAAWVTASGRDANSISANPGFVSSNNLHISGTTNVLSVNVHPLVNVDYDNIGRCSSPTDIGADHHPGNNDIGISSLIYPTGGIASLGTRDVVAVLKNFGSNTLTSANVSYLVGGVTKTIGWTGSLGLCDSAIITFTGSNQYTFAGAFSIKFFTDSPNGVTDVNVTNDTLLVNGCIGLAGNYTINPSGSGSTNFTTFSAAIAAMSGCGIAGPVVFNVAAANYTDQISIGFINGTSAINTITFDGGVGNASSRVLSPASTSAGLPYVWRFNAAQYIIVKNMTIRGIDATNSWGVHFLNSTNCKIVNCTIDNSSYGSTGSGSNVVGIVLNGSATTLGTSSAVLNNNYVDSCSVTSGYYNIVIYGNNGSLTNYFRNNTLSNFYYYGIYGSGAMTLKILNNNIAARNPYSTNSTNIYLSSCSPSSGFFHEISSNRLSPVTYYGIYLQSCTGNAAANSIISNNFVYGPHVYPSNSWAIYLSSCNFWKVQHNTINYLNSLGNYPAYGLYVINGGSNEVVNNIFSSTEVASAQYTPLYIAPVTAVSVLNYNNYFNAGSTALVNLNGTILTPSNFKLAFPLGGGLNSINLNPMYTTNTNLHINAPCNDAPTVGITTDIDGDTRGTTPDMGADEMSNIPSNDIGVSVLNAPAFPLNTGTQNVTITVKNFGNNVVTSGVFYYSINGATPVSQSWSGSLVTCAEASFTFSTQATIGMGSNTIKVYTALPNGVSDAIKTNDTLQISLCPAMAGIYTINPSGSGASNYTSFGAAISALTCAGVKAPVVFDISSGTYNTPFTIPSINGASATNTITFKSAANNASSVVLRSNSSGSANNFIVKMDGCDYIRLSNLTFAPQGVTYGNAIWMLNTADYNIIDSCIFNGLVSTSTGNNLALFYVNSTKDNYNIISNSVFNNASMGIYWYSNTSSYAIGNQILKNTFNNQYYAGIYTYYHDYVRIKQNTINTVTAYTSYYGVYNYFSYNTSGPSEITKNRIFATIGGGYGINNYYANYGASASNRFLLANNMIQLTVTGTSTSYGIQNQYSYYIDILHNTVNIMAQPTGTSYAFYNYYFYSTGCFVQNNVFVNSNTTATSYAVYEYLNSAGTWNNNNYFTRGTVFGQWSGVAKANFAAWKATVAGLDALSTNLLPIFNSATDLGFTNLPCIDGLGANVLSKVGDDIYGNSRSTTPDAGAVENTPLPLDASAFAVRAPVGSLTVSSAYNVIITVRNLGSTVITSLEVGYTVNGGTAQSQLLNSITLNPCDTMQVTFNSTSGPGVSDQRYVAIAGLASIKAYTADPNATTDYNLNNDTSTVIFCTPFSGTFTIDQNQMQSGTNFPSFGSAVAALYSCGVNGPVVFNVAAGSGPYLEQVTFTGRISGANATNNTITFDGGSTKEAISFNATIAANQHTVRLNSAKGIILNNLTINTLNLTNGIGVHLTNTSTLGADSNIIMNCVINVAGTTLSNRAGIAISSTASPIGAGSPTGGYGNFNTIQNNTINGGYYGISYTGNTTTATTFNRNNVVLNNNITNAYFYALYAQYQSRTKINGNTISNSSLTTSSYGIYINYVDSFEINKNKINNVGTYGIYLQYANYLSNTGTYRSSVVNNMIGGNYYSTGTKYGIYIASSTLSKYIDFHHNTVSINNPIASTAYAFYITGTSTGLSIVNNSFTTYNGTSAAAYIYAATSGLLSFNYNNIWNSLTSNAQLITGTGTSYSANSWIGINGYNINSKWLDPKYIDPINNLHSIELNLNDSGQNIATVTDDIDGDTRPIIAATNVDIGADEYTPPALNIGAVALVSPGFPLTPGLQNVVAVFKNFGTAVITSANINYKVGINGTPRTITYTGSLTNGSSALVTFTNANQYNFVGTNNDTVYVYTSAPNGGVDGYTVNDTVRVILCAQLSGNYTINPAAAASNTNFTSFSAAAAKLASCGVSGPVVFTVSAGTYDEQVDILPIGGASATNTITFDGGTGNASTRIISPNTTTPTAANPYVWRFNAAQFVTVRNMTITGTNGTNCWNVNFLNAVSCKVSNCILDNPTFGTGSTTGVQAIIMNGSTTSYSTSSTITNDNYVDSNIVSTGYAGIYCALNNSSNTNYVRGNTFTNFYFYGTIFSGAQAVKVLNNTYTCRPVYQTNTYSCYLSSCSPAAGLFNEVSGNKFTQSVYMAIYLPSCTSNPISPSIVSNNFISGQFLYPSNVYGIYLTSSNYWRVYHNSINFNQAGNYTSYGLNVSNGSFIDVRNNIWANGDATALNFVPAYISPATAVSNLDYNIYFNVANNNLLNIGGSIFTPSTIKQAFPSGGGINSISQNPTFVSLTDLHVTSRCNDGINLGVTTDIDGNTRSSSPDIGADESTVTPPNSDISVMKINSPRSPLAPGSQTINVTIKNLGGNTITSGNISYQLNGGSVIAATFSGSLGTCDTLNYTFTTPATFIGGTNTLKVFTSSPNGVTDINPANDTAQSVLCTSLSGAYTINPSGSGASNYTSFTNAVNAMLCGGITGPVEFTVSTGSYSEQISIPLVSGLSATNTITFKSATGIATDVVLQFNGASNSANNYVVDLNGGSYLNFQNMTIQNVNGSWGVVLWQRNNSRFNTFQNVVFTGANVASTSTNMSLVYANNGSVVVPGQGDDNNTFNQCTFNNGAYGIYYYGYYGNVYSYNNRITNSTFTNQYYMGMYLYYHFNFTVSGNTIATNSSYSNFYGIYTYGAGVANTGEARITKNNIRVTNNGYGMYLQYFLGANTLTANNMVYIGSGTGTSYALYAQYCGGKFYHNTFVNYSGLTTGQSVYLYNNSTSYGVNDFKLNIVASPGNGTASGRCIYSVTNSTATQLIDSNVYYQGAGAVNFGSFNGTPYSTIALWRTGMGAAYDPKSIVVNPNFVSATNLHINQAANLLSVPVNPDITDDIDNTLRCATTTDVGADHHPTTNDIGVSSVVNPFNGVANAGTQDIVLVLRNFGSNTLTSANISYKDNTTTKTIAWTGSLNTCDTALITFTGANQYTFGGAWSLKFFTDSPNGVSDGNKTNDTIAVSGCVGLVGTYTIDPFGSGGTNYLSFGAAITAMSGCGIAGPVVFNVAANAYFEQVNIPNIAGTSATNTITFDGGTGNASTRIITAATTASSPHILRFNNCNYVTVKNVTLRSTGTTDAWVAHFMNGTNNRLNNSVIEITGAGANNTGSNTIPVVVNGSLTSLGTTSTISNNNTLDNCTLNAGYYSIYATINNNVNTLNILNNIINDGYQYGLYAINPFSLRFRGNTVNMLEARTNPITSNYAVFVQSINNSGNSYFEISGNKVLNPGLYGIYIGSCTNSGTAFNQVYNNMVGGGFVYTFGAYGIYLTSTTRTQVYHNSVSLDAPSTSGTNAALFVSSGSGNDLRNNNLRISGSANVNSYALYLSAATVATNVNYNNYFNLGGPNLLYVGGVIGTAANFTSVGGGTNSLNLNPLYVSALDLHTTMPCNNAASVGVTTDIDGTTRATLPDIGADEIVAVSNDLSVVKFNSPLSPVGGGAQTVNVTIRNLGSNSVTSASLNYSINGGTPITQTWTGTIAPCDTLNFSFTTTVSLSSGVNVLKSYATLPNGVADANNSNDTAASNLCVALNGVYTIDPSGSGATNYTSFTNAVNDLMCGGISGPVIFNVAAATYNEQVSISAIGGASATNTITFDGGNGNASNCILTFAGTALTPHTLRLNNCNFVTLRNLRIVTTDVTNGWAVNFLDGTNNRLTNCQVENIGSLNLTATNLIPVVINGNATSSTSSSTISNNHMVDSNMIVGGYYSMVVSINNTNNLLTVTKNTINDAYLYGFYGLNSYSLRFRGNNVNMLSSRLNPIVSSVAVYLVSSNNTGSSFYEVSGNTVSNAGQYGLYFNSCSNTGTAFNQVFNNMIAPGFRNATGSAAGIFLTSCTRTRIYHNSVNFDAPSTAGTNAALYVNAGSLIDVRNNILVASNPTAFGSYALWIPTASAVSNLDYNVYFNRSSSNLITIASTNYTSSSFLGLYPAGGGYSSKNTDPLFVSNNNLHTISPCNNGANLGITADFDGDSRGSIPDMGADEIPTAGDDIGVLKINPPAFPISATSQNVNVTLYNYGNTLVTTANVSYRVNGGSVVTQAWTGSLYPCDTQNFVFTTPYTFATGANSFKIYTSAPNGVSDPIKGNDTLNTTLCTAMSGVYTINPSGSGATNYTSFNNAVNALVCAGVNGAVVFNVAAATYTEQVIMPSIQGSSVSNTITFDGGNGNAATRILTFAGSATIPATVNMTSNTTFRNLTIQTTGVLQGWGVSMANDVNSRLNNCIVEVASPGDISTLATFMGVVMSGGGATSNYTTQSSVCNNNTIDSCTIKAGYYGIYSSINNGSYTNTFNKNTLLNQYLGALYMNGAQTVKITNNAINMRNTVVTSDAITLVNCNPVGSNFTAINNNVIMNMGRDGIFISNASGSATDSGEIINNMIGGGFRSFQAAGIYSSGSRWNIWHNSINNDAPITSTGTGIYLAGGSLHDVRNNIIAITNPTSVNSYPMFIGSSSYVSALDNNNYFSTPIGSALVYIGGNVYGTTNYKVAFPSGGGLGSVNADPSFVSAMNLHITNGCNNGDNLFVTTDIDGNSRSSLPDIGADELPLLGLDVQVVGVRAPVGNSVLASTPYTVTFTVKNNGSSTITSLDANYSINGTTNNETFTTTAGLPSGGLLPCDTVVISFTNQATFVSGVSVFKVYTGLVNTASDQNNLNDTATTIFCTPFTGNFTINALAAASSTNFRSFNDAVAAIYNCSVSGPVTFRVVPGSGPYNEQVHFNGPIPGASAINNVTFKGGANKEVLTYNASINNSQYTVRLNGTRYVTLDSLTINTTNFLNGIGVHLTNVSDSNTISNCNINIGGTLNNRSGIAISGIGTSAATTGNSGNYNLILNNVIDGGNYAVLAFGASSSQYAMGNRIIGNRGTNSLLYAISLQFQDLCTVTGNTLSTLSTAITSEGIHAVYVDRFDISNNQINNVGAYGIYLQYANWQNGTGMARASLVNNMIGGTFYGSNPYGIYLAPISREIDIFHNSVSLNNTVSGMAFYMKQFIAGDYTGLDVRNNSFATFNTNTHAAYFYYGATQTSPFVNLNNNNIWNSNTAVNPVFVRQTAFATNSWIGAFGLNSNSKWGNPSYLNNATNLHSLSDQLNDAGVNIGSVTTDIDGNTRPLSPSTTVDIGADEYAANIFNITNPPAVCTPNTVNITAAAVTAGATAGYTLTYWTNATATVSLSNPTAVAVSGTYYIKATQNSTGYVNIKPVVVVVNPLPSTPMVSSPVTYCQGTTSSALTATPVSGNTLNWYTTATGGTASSTAPTPSTLTVGSTKWYVSQTSAAGCEGARDSITVVINETPAAPSVTSPITYCQNATASALTATPSSGNSLRWYATATGGSFSVTAPTPVTTAAGTFSFYVSQITPLGCEGPRAELQVVVTPATAITVQPNSLTQCGGTVATLSVTAIGTGTITYQWFKGTSPISGQTNSTYVISNLLLTDAGSYKVEVTSNCGGTVTSNTVTITVASEIPIVTPSSAVICAGSTTTFTATAASAILSYQWKLNGSDISGATSPTYTTSTAGNYSVFVNYVGGCTNLSAVATAVAAPKPSAGFTANATVQCFAANAFVFTNTTTISSGTLSYLWKFGDGTTSTATSPTKSYSATGSYVVTLIATSNNGCVDSTSQSMLIYVSPVTSFTSNAALNQCFTGNNFSFTNTSTIASGNMSFLWSFGDGTTSGTTNITSKSYANAGTYSVKLVATSNNGCKDSSTQTITVFPKANVSFTTNSASQCFNGNSFVFTNTSSIASGSLSYLWSFGDGSTSTLAAPAAKVYASAGYYIVKLVATSNNGCMDSATTAVTVNPKPTVGFTVNNATQCFNTNSFVFTNTSSIASGTITYAWTFGDGSSATVANPTKSYLTSSTFAVKLVATSNLGCKDSSTIFVTVNPNPAPSAPTGSMNVCSSINALSATPVTYTTTLVSGLNYSWTLTGGTVSGSASGLNQNSVNVLWGPAGTGSVTVTLTNPATGCSGSATLTGITISPSPTAIVAGATSVCLNSTTYYSLGNTAGGTITGYNWTVTGGTIVSGQSTSGISVSWSSTGAKTIACTITNSNGCTGITPTFNVTVNPNPLGTFTGTTVVCPGVGYTYTATSSGSTYVWTANGGNITSQSGNTVTIIWSNVSSASLVLNETFATGCNANSSQTITVNGPLNAVISGVNQTCATTSRVYTLSGATSTSWTVTGGTITASNGSSATVTWNTVGSQVLTANYSNGSCNYSTTFGVNVNALPTPTVTGLGTACTGVAMSYTTPANGGRTYTWTVSSGGSISSGGGTNSISVIWNSPGAQTVSVSETIIATGCSANSNVFNVNVVATPAATITGNTSACSGGTFTYTGPVASTYAWSVVGGTISGSSTNSTVSIVWGTGTLGSVSLVASNGSCASSSNLVVNINATPTPVITGANAICSGTTSVYSTAFNSNYSYTWSVTNGTFTAGSNTNAINVTPNTGATSVTVAVTVSLNGTVCNGTTSKVVTVNLTPTVSMTGNTTVCQNSTQTYTGVGGSTYSFSVTGGIITSTTSTTANVIWGNANGTITITGVSAAGCTSSATYPVTVNSLPSSVITGALQVCANNSSTYSVASQGGATYLWTATGGTITGGSTGNSVTINWGVTAGSGTVNVTVTSGAGCLSTRTMNVTINVQPAPSITGSVTACVNTTQTYSVVALAASAYNWSVTGGSIVSGAGTNSVNVIWNTVGSGSISVSQGVGICVGSTSTSITINAAPATPTVFRVGNLLSTSAVASTYQWLNNGIAIGGATGATHTATIAGTYSVVVTNAAGCSATSVGVIANVGIKNNAAISKVEVYPNPTIGLVTISATFDKIQDVTMRVYDVNGKLVYEFIDLKSDLNYTKNISLEGYASGVYVVHLITNNGTVQKRIVKE